MAEGRVADLDRELEAVGEELRRAWEEQDYNLGRRSAAEAEAIELAETLRRTMALLASSESLRKQGEEDAERYRKVSSEKK